MIPKFVVFGAALLGLAQSVQAQSPHAGTYNGYFYARLSGRVEQSESPIGPALLNIDGSGAVRQSGGGLIGQADTSGTITWQTPNAFLFTSGSVRDGIVSATGSRTDAGLTTTFRLEARGGPGAPGGGGFGQALRLVHPIPHVDELEGAAFGNGTYVAVGRGGLILRSPNAVQWMHVPTGVGTALQDVTFGNGRFLAVGHGGRILVSTDNGLTWSAKVSGTTFDFFGVSHGNGQFVAVGRAGIRTSPDGENWTAASIANSTVDQWDSVDFVNGRFVAAGGRSGTSLHNEITLSTDGLTWTPAQSYNANLRTSTFQAA